MRAAIIETEPTFVAGAPEVLFEGPYLLGSHTGREYDISPDGERFLVLKIEGERQGPTAEKTMVVVENWFEELKRLAPSSK